MVFVVTVSELLIYSWSRLDAPMPTGAMFSDYNRVITIHNVQLAHEGTYRCRVTRQLGQETYGDLTIAIEGTSLHCPAALEFYCQYYVYLRATISAYSALLYSGASIPIYRWRQMRHGKFWGGMKNQFWGE